MITYIMAYVPTYSTNNGVGCINPSGSQKIGFSDSGVNIDYNLTASPQKHFTLTPSGITWTDGTTTYSTGLEKLSAVETALHSVELPPNGTTLQINNSVYCVDSTNPQFTSTHRNDYFDIQDTINGTIYSFNENTLQINDPPNTSYINMSPPGGLLIQNDVKGGNPPSVMVIDSTHLSIADQPGFGTRTGYMDAGSVSISDGTTMTTYIDAGDATFTATGSGEYTTLTPTTMIAANPGTNTQTSIGSVDILMTDNTTNIQAELSNDVNTYSEPFLRLRNQNGSDNFLRFSELNIDAHINFAFNQNQSFFRQLNPFSFSCYNLNDGDYIEKFIPFAVADNITTLKLRNPTDYLDTNGNFGWSCIVSNISGGSVLIDTAGYQWYAHSNGLGGGPIDLNKWSTARITLIYSYNTVGDYVWAVSEF